MKKLILLFIAFPLLSMAATTIRPKNGGWVSSGGELFRDAKNPWFVRNTLVVNYCVLVDNSTISATTDEIQTVIEDGLQYWQQQFSVQNNTEPGHFQLATQKFNKVNCSEKPALTFQFGFGTLDTLQLAKLEKPEKFIGVTVRTDYDLQNLSAKGFIYFSSDLGPNAYDNDNGTLITKAWSRKKILSYAVLHELGHVFGLPHMGSGLMSEVFLNQILNKQLVEKYERSPIDSFIQINNKVEVCDIDRKTLSWFAAANDATCISMETLPFGNLKVFSKKTSTDSEISIGEFRQVNININDIRAKPSLILHLPEEQKVFSGVESEFRNFLFGPLMMDTSATAMYFANGSIRPQTAFINFTPQSFSVQGLIQNKIDIVFSYNSPLSLLLIISPHP
ncbi:MAG: hypothetical protein WA160_05845 [Pseudobdellovibrio sp.]